MMNVQALEFGYGAVALILVLGIKDLDEINSDEMIDFLMDKRRKQQLSRALRFNWPTRIESIFYKKGRGLNFSNGDLLARGSVIPSICRESIVDWQKEGILRFFKLVNH